MTLASIVLARIEKVPAQTMPKIGLLEWSGQREGAWVTKGGNLGVFHTFKSAIVAIQAPFCHLGVLMSWKACWNYAEIAQFSHQLSLEGAI